MGGSMTEGGLIVISDMGLALVSVIANLVVISSIREWEGLMNITYSFLVANLCFANLISAVFVKSISVVRNGYAVASNSTASEVAFCSIQSLGHRATLAVYPWTLVCMCWVFIAHFYSRKNESGSLLSSLNADIEEEKRESEEGKAGIMEKGLLGGVWGLCFMFGFLGESCEIRENPFSKGGMISSMWLFVLPMLVGPILSVLVAITLSILKCGGCCGSRDAVSTSHSLPGGTINSLHTQALTESVQLEEAIYLRGRSGTPESSIRSGTIGHRQPAEKTPKRDKTEVQEVGRLVEHSASWRGSNTSKLKSRETSALSHICCLTSLTFILTFTFFTGQIFSEVWEMSLLYYILLKCVVGTSHHLLVPLAILASYQGLRKSAKIVFLRGGTIQNKTKEIAMAEVKKELGIICDSS